ncbi:hypothetical protein IR605_004188 [Salmonella enterica]|uniref:Uncharacterized protein n=1 Tax=Salmonella newport TaxID=108619 RepID=A0A5W1Z7J4_SALNE|nr:MULTISPECIES: hypothetical protein [Enterobacterales]EAT4546160.1 hypothetical protein [Salmonella enterica]EBW3121720.1 hypothetical protein [Salmonella enterica subsp. enterica serovar Newport]EHL6329347.1 hypothetical protein [Escherichia coli]EIW8478642.1 hypothetical protein [Klebsiella pneumoniae]ELY2734963.1 hypothetical protein [Cronobacter sakazakii]
MKHDAVKTVYDLMRYCHMPMWCQREVRDMKVGDIYFLGKYKEVMYSEDLNEDVDFVGEAWIEKERGIYKFYATWTIPMKPSRSFIMTNGGFKVLKGGAVNFGGDLSAFRSFALVSRYLNRLVMKMSNEERNEFYKVGSKPLLRGICIDKDSISRRPHYIKEGESIRRVWLNYSNQLPTHPLQAIVTSAIALKQI